MRTRIRWHSHLLGRRQLRPVVTACRHHVDRHHNWRVTHMRTQDRRFARVLGRERQWTGFPSLRQDVRQHQRRVHPYLCTGEQRYTGLLGRRRERTIVAAYSLDIHRDQRRRGSYLRPHFYRHRHLLGRRGQRPRPGVPTGKHYLHGDQCGLSPHVRDQGRRLRSLLGAGQREPGVRCPYRSDTHFALVRTAA